MNGFAKRTQTKKQAILEATTKILLEKGYSYLKIEDVAKKANVSQVTIYNYFGSKKKLIQHVIMKYMNERFNIYKEIISEQKPFPDMIRTIMLERKKYANILNGEEFVEIYENDSELKEFCEDYYEAKIIPLFLHFIQRGKEEGYFRKDISDEAILLYLDAMKTIIDQNIQQLMKKPHVEQFFDQLFDLFFYGLLNERKELQ